MSEALLETRRVEKTTAVREAPSEKVASSETPPQLDLLVQSAVEQTVFEKTVLEKTVLEKAVLEKAVLEKTVLEKTVIGEVRRDSQVEPKEYIAEVVAGGGE